MATRQEDQELDFTQDESEDEPPSALAQQEASTREDEDPGDQPTKEDYESEAEPTFKEIHEQYDRLAEKGEDEPLADLYKDRFVGLYYLSGDKRRYLHNNLKGSLRALEEATTTLDAWVDLGKKGDNSDYRGEFDQGEVPTLTDSQGRERLIRPAYQATVMLAEDAPLLKTGLRGRSRFLVDTRTSYQWLRRWWRTTFKFRL